MRGARAIGVPGCPDFACWTASIASVRIVSMHRASICSDEGSGFGFAAVDGCAMGLDRQAVPVFGDTRGTVFGDTHKQRTVRDESCFQPGVANRPMNRPYPAITVPACR